ncbi:MAG: pyridoxal phosphate-dependent class II aminotransferase [Desulfobacterales bacterium]|nr:pyridoxal phosphate-dependent class II aminotransferase [Desulfobacterales bacterium]MBS3754872.1 pyridoxal phosphate-dependent class II aminotransferase [Desulfobacterales bacterium]
MIHGHGGNIYAAASALGCRLEEITDMSANINPLGPMPGLLAHLAESIGNVCRLPEVDAASAVHAYADWQDLPAEQVIAGGGTTEFLYLLPRALRLESALVVGPAYADYADALKINRVDPEFFMCTPEHGFRPDPDRLAAAARNADAVYFCNPNNPTGRLTAPGDLAALAGALPQTLFVVDESYLPFAAGPKKHTLARFDLPNTVVLHSLSKMHCIPGLRVGFCVAPAPLAQKIRQDCQPWSVSTPAQTAISYIAQNRETAGAHARKTRQSLDARRRDLYASLADTPGLDLYPSHATFVLMRAAFFTAPEIAARMLSRRILIRDCSNFRGLDEHYFRISLKDPDSNARAAQVIAEYARHRAAGRKPGKK